MQQQHDLNHKLNFRLISRSIAFLKKFAFIKCFSTNKQTPSIYMQLFIIFLLPLLIQSAESRNAKPTTTNNNKKNKTIKLCTKPE